MGAGYAERVTMTGETRAPWPGRQPRVDSATGLAPPSAGQLPLARFDLALVLDRDDGHGLVERYGGERDRESAAGKGLRLERGVRAREKPGARGLHRAARELERKGGRYGLVTLCIGVGQGYAAVIENSNWQA